MSDKALVRFYIEGIAYLCLVGFALPAMMSADSSFWCLVGLASIALLILSFILRVKHFVEGLKK